MWKLLWLLTVTRGIDTLVALSRGYSLSHDVKRISFILLLQRCVFILLERQCSSWMCSDVVVGVCARCPLRDLLTLRVLGTGSAAAWDGRIPQQIKKSLEAPREAPKTLQPCLSGPGPPASWTDPHHSLSPWVTNFYSQCPICSPPSLLWEAFTFPLNG